MRYLTLQRLRKKKAAAMLPLAVLYLLLPGIILMFNFHYREEPEVFQRIVLQQLHVWIPLFSVWWILLLFHDFVDCEGNELLYLYHKPLYFLKSLCLSSVLYSVAVTLFFVVFQRFVPVGFFVLLQLVVEIFVISSLAYFLCFLLQNTGACFLLITAYSFYIILFDQLRILRFMSIFPENAAAGADNIRLIQMSLPAAMLFLAAGFICSRFRRILK